MSRKKDLEKFREMREKLLVMYPSGIIRGQYILQMPESQIYAIYKWHTKKRIATNKPRLRKPSKQIPGQMNMLGEM